MTLHPYMAFYAVGAALIVIGLVVTLFAPAPGVVVLLVGGVHGLIGVALRGREQRSARRQT
jgi:hypothetical protein